jgi:hypothetical protein
VEEMDRARRRRKEGSGERDGEGIVDLLGMGFDLKTLLEVVAVDLLEDLADVLIELGAGDGFDLSFLVEAGTAVETMRCGEMREERSRE